jgi:hypothetical protein
MTQFLPYFVARHAALELDRQGVRPGLVVTVLAGTASAAALGLLAIAGAVACWAGIDLLRIIL